MNKNVEPWKTHSKAISGPQFPLGIIVYTLKYGNYKLIELLRELDCMFKEIFFKATMKY